VVRSGHGTAGNGDDRLKVTGLARREARQPLPHSPALLVLVVVRARRPDRHPSIDGQCGSQGTSRLTASSLRDLSLAVAGFRDRPRELHPSRRIPGRRGAPRRRARARPEQIFSEMRASGSIWMATVDLDDCVDEHAQELGDLAVDLALIALQLVIPSGFGVERMARMSARG
jgi:hypothetical protein